MANTEGYALLPTREISERTSVVTIGSSVPTILRTSSRLNRRHQHRDTDDWSQDTTVVTNKTNKCLLISGSIFVSSLLLASLIVLGLLLVMVGQQPPRVVTSCGAVEGEYDIFYKVFSFKGIPFAAPPIGKNRWSPTQPLNNVTCWEGVYYAHHFKPMCMQLDPTTNQQAGSEDCLYLNIYTPTVDPVKLLPVVFYIHGGCLQAGDGATLGYSPDERLPSQLKMVFVSIQYRLNAFGFLVSSALPGRRGNYGFLDQIEALHWVKENIVAFGGDPNQVTILGQSSGATSVWALMMSPLAKGLFSQACMMSGSAVLNKTLEDAVQQNEWILQKDAIANSCGGNVTEDCLMELSPRTILDAIYPEWNIWPNSMDLPTYGYFEPALAIVDGHVIPGDPFEMWHSRNTSQYSDVPVIIGSTAQEVDLAPTPGVELKSWTKPELASYIADHLDPFGGNITNMSLSLYPWTGDAEYVFTTMTSDLRCVCSMDVLAAKASEALSSKVYRYIVTSVPSKPAHAYSSPFPAKYSFHCWDIYAFFWGFDAVFSNGPSKSDENFAILLRTEIGHFAQTGEPHDEDWLAYPNMTVLVSDHLIHSDVYHQEQCQFWLENGFFSYSWIN